eukprot:CAMPEP_0169267982 /NCGR_PEP_ID=MMETSP1016-20121227/47497_1 /TAXON_ID=342587 /ORGANISM="Karlodinium micrum, Strain CCMP2283" /LENGTH=110 /DNA_ID=CAMNT_0009352543 /DNA_START=35 /DNA_END=363 /DNA_ORIENTATION=-
MALSEDDYKRQVVNAQKVVDGLLKDQPGKALSEALKSAPFGATTKETKDQAASLVLKAATAFKDAEIKKVAETSLSEEERCALMKYLYRFWNMGLPAKTNALLFSWHAAL